MFINMVEPLTKNQINLLEAIVSGVTSLSAAQTLKRYKLGTSASVIKSKEALQKKENENIMFTRKEHL